MSLTLGTCVPYTKKNPSDLGRSKVIPAYYTSDTENLDYTMSHGWEHWWMSFMAWGYPILSRNLQCDCNQRSSGGHQRLNSNTLVVCNALINLLQLLQFFLFLHFIVNGRCISTWNYLFVMASLLIIQSWSNCYAHAEVCFAYEKKSVTECSHRAIPQF